MEKIITHQTLRSFAQSNDHLIKGEVRGIVVNFIGLGCDLMFDGDGETVENYAKDGIIFIHPYLNPWNWMNRQAVAYTDEIIDVLMEAYNIPKDIPVVSSGGSMGGLSALVYTVYTKHNAVACVANCPVCDLPYHYTERPDLPRTLYSAFGTYEDMTMAEALAATSPLHLVEKMPDIDYFIFHCEGDTAVNKQKHSDVFVQALQKNHRVTYHAVPERGHCDLTEADWTLFRQHITDSIKKA